MLGVHSYIRFTDGSFVSQDKSATFWTVRPLVQIVFYAFKAKDGLANV